jgi:phage-related protein
MADAERDLKIVITSDTGNAERNLEGFGGSLKRVGEIAAGLGLEKAAEAVLRFGKELVTSSVTAYQESQNKLAQLNAVLKSTGGVAGMSQEALISLSKQLQNTTTYSDESVMSVENLLLTFTKIGKETFPEATKAVLDMSTALGEDAKSASIQLGKALQDPILGITALRRVGVNFSDDQKKMIEGWVKQGETLKAQQFILKEIATEFGGSAAAAAGTFDGKMKQLKNTVDDLKEVFGKLLVEAINPFLEKISSMAKVVLSLAEGHKQWSDIMNLLNTKTSMFGAIIGQVLDVLKNIFTPVLKELQLIWQKHHDTIVLLAGVLGALLGGALIILLDVLAALVKALLIVFDKFFSFVEWAGKTLPVAINFLSGVLNSLGNAFKSVAKIAHEVWTSMSEMIKGEINKIIGSINGLIQGANWAFKKVPGNSINIPTIPMLASGVTNFSGGMALVGEQGPELVNLPSGSNVLPADKTRNALGGINITINNPSIRSDNDITDLVNQIKRALGRENELARLALI